MLPGDNYLSLATKWYSVRHAPGALNGRRAEWTLFVDCLQDFLGYTGSRALNNKASRVDASLEVRGLNFLMELDISVVLFLLRNAWLLSILI